VVEQNIVQRSGATFWRANTQKIRENERVAQGNLFGLKVVNTEYFRLANLTGPNWSIVLIRLCLFQSKA
jgi:hypothetical protein